ncbi:MAG: c-type cytochrome [Ferruginibacter sp.]
MKKSFKADWPLYLIFLVIATFIAGKINQKNTPKDEITFGQAPPDEWLAPSLYMDNITKGEQRKKIIYGEDLIANTSKYLGPHGSVMQITNGMNCQNCHLDAGTRPWGNNYGAVGSTYPKFRERSGTTENIPKRVNDCIERSLNGKALDTSGYEMKSIVAYMKWLGQNVKKGDKPKGAGLVELPYLDRAASPASGQIVYSQKCQSCHGINGEGLKNANDISYTYPPLWGEHSYNTGAGLFRISRFAGYAKDNMPFNQSTHQAPVLTDEEAWNVAAFVNSQPRPQANINNDWPKIAAKPIDHPFGPYADGFSEEQHKYGPFKAIAAKRKEMKTLTAVDASNTKK